MIGVESRCLDYLPLPLWMRIVSFLPAISLVPLRSVCKFFRNIVDDPYFVSLHLRSFPANLHETRCLTLRPICDEMAEMTVRQVLETESSGSIDRIEKALGYTWWSVAGSIDGLLLMFAFEEAIMWNPSINRIRRIPSPSNSMFDFRFMGLGLGYDDSCQDYKALAVIDHTIWHMMLGRSLEDAAGAWVYSVKRGSWESVAMPTCRDRRKVSESLCFKGGLVWIEGVDTGHSYYHHLARFDFATEKFTYTWVPYPIKKNLWVRNRLVLIDGGSSLGVWGLGSDDLVYIWAMDAGATSWTRLCNIGEGKLQIGAYRNGEMMWEYCTKGAKPKISLYNDTEDHVVDHDGVMYMGVYLESLVLA